MDIVIGCLLAAALAWGLITATWEKARRVFDPEPPKPGGLDWRFCTCEHDEHYGCGCCTDPECECDAYDFGALQRWEAWYQRQRRRERR